MVLTTLILSSCSTLNESATQAGTAAARVNMPPLPDDCRVVEPHAPLIKGFDPVSVLKRERAVTNRANDRVLRCAENYDNVARVLR